MDPFTSTLHSSLMSDMFSSLFSSPTFSNHSQLQVRSTCTVTISFPPPPILMVPS